MTETVDYNHRRGSSVGVKFRQTCTNLKTSNEMLITPMTADSKLSTISNGNKLTWTTQNSQLGEKTSVNKVIKNLMRSKLTQTKKKVKAQWFKQLEFDSSLNFMCSYGQIFKRRLAKQKKWSFRRWSAIGNSAGSCGRVLLVSKR